MKEAIKEVATELNKEDQNRENRLKNVIIYRAPEPHDPSAKNRAEHDTKLINELLETIDIDAKPIKIIRLGKYKQPNEGEKSTRPIKLTFDSHTTQQDILKNATKLQEAEEHLKQLSIRYDLSEDERNAIKELVEEAKEK